MAEHVAIKPGTQIFSIFKKAVNQKAGTEAGQEARNEYFKELYENINDAYLEWQNALSNFETADCKDMVDYFSYRIKASQIRYEHLLRKAKQMQIQ